MNSSHELLTPLQVVLKISKHMHNWEQLPKNLLRMCGLIISAGEGLSTIIDDILEFQSAQQNDSQISALSFSLREFLHQVVKSPRSMYSCG
jgi:signal transduction histidine kinase